MEVSGKLYALAALSPRKEFLILNRRAVGAKSQSGRCGREENLVLPVGIIPRPSSLSLYRLSHPVFLSPAVDSTNFTVQFDENSQIQKFRLSILQNMKTKRDVRKKTKKEIEDEYG
jgi:hypothetical protein